MDRGTRNVVYKIKTDLDGYEVIEELYTGRPSRVLYGGRYKTAQSGIPLDNTDLMLFEYNQRLVELITEFKPASVLAIGGGAFTLPSYISLKMPDIQFDVIEPDSKLESLAKKYFNLSLKANINVINESGLHYLKKNKKRYDLIIVDAYFDNNIPKEVLTKKFAKLLSSAINKRGIVAANVISDLSSNSAIKNMHDVYSKYFKLNKLYPAGPERFFYYPTNFIYVFSNNPINFELKFPALSKINVGS